MAMLSRTADNLYWIARYMERADADRRALCWIARTWARDIALLEVGSRISLIPSAHGYRSEWDSLLQATGHGRCLCEEIRRPGAAQHRKLPVLRPRQPVLGRQLHHRARENGRIVRTALTTQVWDALNTAFQELRRWSARRAASWN
jgi:uncharacterized alpha-E superfamily protein